MQPTDFSISCTSSSTFFISFIHHRLRTTFAFFSSSSFAPVAVACAIDCLLASGCSYFSHFVSLILCIWRLPNRNLHFSLGKMGSGWLGRGLQQRRKTCIFSASFFVSSFRAAMANTWKWKMCNANMVCLHKHTYVAQGVAMCAFYRHLIRVPSSDDDFRLNDFRPEKNEERNTVFFGNLPYAKRTQRFNLIPCEWCRVSHPNDFPNFQLTNLLASANSIFEIFMAVVDGIYRKIQTDITGCHSGCVCSWLNDIMSSTTFVL